MGRREKVGEIVAAKGDGGPIPLVLLAQVAARRSAAKGTQISTKAPGSLLRNAISRSV